MKSNEFRIGNYYFDGVSYSKVISIDEYGINPFDGQFCKQYEGNEAPIPLTEGWLFNFGFQQSDSVATYFKTKKAFIYKNYILFYIVSPCVKNEENELTFFSDISFQYLNGHGINKEIEYVHQLQNLYFALIGEELELVK